MTDDIRALIDNDETVKNLVISFPDAVGVDPITNAQIYSEDFRIEEILTDNNDLTFGICASNLMTVKVADFNDDVRSENVTVDVTFTNSNTTQTTYTQRLFTGVVKTIQRAGDRRFRIITATDYMSKFNIDIADWYNNTLFPTDDTTRTLSYIINALCTLVGVSYNNAHFSTLPFQSLEITKNLNPTRLSGRSFLRQLCEINACMGHFDNNGVLDFIMITNKDPLFPSVSLYPSATLYPSANTYVSGFDTEYVALYKDVEYDEYNITAINAVQIRDESDTISKTVVLPGVVKQNKYVITGNSFVYGLTDAQLTTLASTMLGNIKDFPYRVFELTMKGGTYIPLGSPVQVTARYYNNDGTYTDVVFNSFCLQRTISGVQGMFTTIGATGSEYRAEVDETITDDVEIIRGKLAQAQAATEEIASTDVLKVDDSGIIYNVSLDQASSSGNAIKIGGWVIDTNDMYAQTTESDGTNNITRTVKLDGDDGEIVCQKYVVNTGASTTDNYIYSVSPDGLEFTYNQTGHIYLESQFPFPKIVINQWGITGYNSSDNVRFQITQGAPGDDEGFGVGIIFDDAYAISSGGVYRKSGNTWTKILS